MRVTFSIIFVFLGCFGTYALAETGSTKAGEESRSDVTDYMEQAEIPYPEGLLQYAASIYRFRQ